MNEITETKMGIQEEAICALARALFEAGVEVGRIMGRKRSRRTKTERREK